MIGQNMLIVSSSWQNADTFKLIPIKEDCPYNEMIYDVNSAVLVVIAKSKSNQYKMIPKLDDNGDVIRVTPNKPRPQGQPMKEQRVLIELNHEFLVTKLEEQREIIKMFAVNAETYPINTILRDLDKESKLIKPEKQGIVDKNGMPLKGTKKIDIKETSEKK